MSPAQPGNPATDSRATRRPLAWLYAGLFLAATSLPAARLVLASAVGIDGADEGVEREMRATRPRPELTLDVAGLEGFPRAFERWYGNHFVLRSALVLQHNFLKYLVLATAPSEKFVVGEDGWMFYTDNRALEQSRGALPFAPGEVDGWRERLEERSAFLAELGCQYVFAMAPSKAQVYPEHLPPGYQDVGPGRLDELVQAMEGSPVEFVDLRAALREERANDRGGDLVYFPFGTHWTDRGALRACRELVSRAPALPALPPLEAFERKLIPESQGDSWGERLYLEAWLRQEDWAWRAPGTPRPQPVEIGPGRTSGAARSQSARYEAGDSVAALPHVVFYHDSFGTAVRRHLARCSSVLDCFWTSEWDLALLQRDPPDVLVEVITDRKLATIEASTLALQTQARLAARFHAASGSVWRTDGIEEAMPVPTAGKLRRGLVPIGGLPKARARGTAQGDIPGFGEWVVAVELEGRGTGLVELILGLPAAGREREGEVSRVFVGGAPAPATGGATPTRTCYFLIRPGERPRTLWLAAEAGGWQVRAAEARAVAPR